MSEYRMTVKTVKRDRREKLKNDSRIVEYVAILEDP